MKKILYSLLTIFTLVGCESLEVDNPNNPDRAKVYSSSRDLKIYSENIYLTYWQATHVFYGVGDEITIADPQITALVAADQFTASWGNFACRYVSNEPRIPWDNTVNADNDNVTEAFYKQMYSVLYMCNTVITLINGGKKLGTNGSSNTAILSMCYFLQGAALGQLGLTFDQAQIVKENTDLGSLNFSPYQNVIKSAIESLEKSISISDTAIFSLGSTIVNGTNLDNSLLNKICHSYIARFMVLGSRTKSENTAVDWSTVLSHAQKGVSEDFGPQGDALGGQEVKWYDRNMWLLNNKDNTDIFYAKVDCRLINLMDPDYPARYPANGKAPQVHAGLRPGEAQSIDNRLSTDFEYSSQIKFYPERGKYHYSHYRFKRFEAVSTTGIGQLIDFPYYENSLYAAEAYAMLGQLGKAIAVVNYPDYPRTLRGGLSPLSLTADKKAILNTIFYEREIELLAQGYLIGFCDMRRRDMLQIGTPLHFPVPGLELQTLQLANYTFGGVDQADGTNTSNGGWDK